MTFRPVKRALLSVANKAGLVDFARMLHALHIEIISTGGTSQLLNANHIPHKQVEDITGFAEMLGGRVKTLHPLIHGAILGKRDHHQQEATKHNIEWIDLVVVNFYPFADAVADNPALTLTDGIEYIDIGGPTLLRAAAKNNAWVAAVSDPGEYQLVAEQLTQNGGLTDAYRLKLAAKVFAMTSSYDVLIHNYLLQQCSDNTILNEPNKFTIDLHLEKKFELRYGENPHQKACAYQLHDSHQQSGVLDAMQYQGKALSYNNILDTDAALACLSAFHEPACVIVKHANPCAVATADNSFDALVRAYQADSVSAFGGIIALNQLCTKAMAEFMTQYFFEVIIAPAYSDEALHILGTKPNLRVLSQSNLNVLGKEEMRFIHGGVLWQEKDDHILAEHDVQCVTQTKPTQVEIADMLFAWRVLKHMKSNAILIAKNKMTIGMGAGQVSRIDAVDLAIYKAGERISDCILASDAFFPFRDSIDRIAKSGIHAIIQPGGSVRDQEVIAACNENNIAMLFTGIRCFKH